MSITREILQFLGPPENKAYRIPPDKKEYAKTANRFSRVGITISLTLNDVGVFMAGIVAERSFWWRDRKLEIPNVTHCTQDPT